MVMSHGVPYTAQPLVADAAVLRIIHGRFYRADGTPLAGTGPYYKSEKRSTNGNDPGSRSGIGGSELPRGAGAPEMGRVRHRDSAPRRASAGGDDRSARRARRSVGQQRSVSER